MTMKRRDFLGASASLAAGLALGIGKPANGGRSRRVLRRANGDPAHSRPCGTSGEGWEAPVVQGGYGLADLENKVPMTIDTIQNIASISKTFTATALMQMWQERKFQLDDAVDGYLPFRVRNPAVSGFTPPKDSPLFSLQNPEQLRREMAEAGLDDVRVETANHGMEIQSATHLWNLLTPAAPPIGALVAKLTEQQRSAVREALDGMLRQRRGEGTAVMNMQVHIGIGTK